jgi:hypothetical protein
MFCISEYGSFPDIPTMFVEINVNNIIVRIMIEITVVFVTQTLQQNQ